MVKKAKFTEQIPVTSHLIELRDRFVIVGGTVLVFFGLCLYFVDILILWLEDPLPPQFKELTFISPTEPFFTAMKVSIIGALFITMPLILYHIWEFISPGLKVKEKKITAMFVLFGTFFFLFGGVFCYFLVLPLGLKFLLMFGVQRWKMEVTIGLLFSFTLKLILAFAFAFQTPLVMVFMTKIGAINTIKMRIYRKWAFLGCFAMAAILTPPDIITQLLLGVPLYLLYEFGVLVSRAFEDPKQREAVLKQMRADIEAKRAAKEAAAAKKRKADKKK